MERSGLSTALPLQTKSSAPMLKKILPVVRTTLPGVTQFAPLCAGSGADRAAASRFR